MAADATLSLNKKKARRHEYSVGLFLKNNPGSELSHCSRGPTPRSRGSIRSARSPQPRALSPTLSHAVALLTARGWRRSPGGARRWLRMRSLYLVPVAFSLNKKKPDAMNTASGFFEE